jgi:hypothetical protein
MLLETMGMAIGMGLSENSSSPRVCPGLHFRVQACVRCFCVVAVLSRRWGAACCLAKHGLARFSAEASVDVPSERRGQ